jgi:DNA replication and repair protein RecF
VETGPEDSHEALAERLGERLAALRAREVQLGQTLVGPHRDDLRLLVGGMDVGQYGSRGQVRTVALALRLAEARRLAETLGDEPLLLLADVLSELDTARQQEVLKAACQAQQALLTMVDTERFPEAAPHAAARFRVAGGSVVAEPLAMGEERGQNGPGEGEASLE